MIQECQDVMVLLERATNEMLREIERVPSEAIDWRPAPKENSAAMLVAHTFGSTRNWFVAIIAKGVSNRDREAEFRAEARDLGDPRRRAEEWLAETRAVLEPLTTADLDAPCDLSMMPQPAQDYFAPGITRRGAMLHITKHFGEHLGHVGLTLQLWRAAQVKAASS